jgi:hypothetical protein
MKNRSTALNRAQFCLLARITKHAFDGFVAEGMPVDRRPASRGDEYRVEVGAALAWMAARVLGKRPARQEPPPLLPPPFGAEILTEIANVGHRVFLAGALRTIYASPRFAQMGALDQGCSEAQAHQIAGCVVQGLMHTIEEVMRDAGEPVFQEPDPSWVVAEAFEWHLPPRTAASPEP